MIENTLISAALFQPHSLQFPNAWVGHLPFAAWVMQEISPKIFVELGTHSGNSYFSFCQSVVESNLSTKCYAVDTWQGDEHAGQYTDTIFNSVDTHNQERYSGFSRLLRLTFDDAVNYFNDGSIDMLHIDGLHTYEAVKHDFETWLPKLAPNAIVMFHDTNVRERNFGVWKLWEELQARYPNHLEFVHSHGLGILQLNTISNSPTLEWLHPKSVVQQRLVRYFASLGAKQLDRFNLQELKQQIVGLQKTLDERNSELSQKSHLLAQESHFLAQERHLLVKNNDLIGKLNSILIERDDTIATIQQSNYDKEIHIGNIERALRASEGTINNHIQAKAEIHNSSSWRLTAPLRFLGHQILRCETIFKGLPYAVSMCNGYRGLLAHVWQTYKSEGIEGIKLRILFAAAPGATPAVIDYAQSNKKDYREWIVRYDKLNETDRIKIKNRISKLSNPPLISVIMPVYNAPLNMLEEAIRSVQAQLYPNWELCIADDASTDPAVHTLLRRYAETDIRIKVTFREKNGHISAASNSALELAKGKYIALMDNDDLLPEHALFWIADALAQNPEAGLIYSDEDKVDEAGRRYDPYFKSDWNPDLFLSHNMICHLGVYRTDLVKEIGGFREGYEGAQDYDLALRCIEKLTQKQIVHIPRVLYHWRSHSGSTAQAGSEKSYALPAGARALNDHFNRIQVTAKTELLNFGMYRTSYAIPIDAPLVSLIIPTRNGLDLVKQCVESILTKTNYKNYEILIVDNNSDDPKALEYFANLTKDSRFRILRDERPFNYSALNNAAVQQAHGEYIGLINNDIEVISPNWLEEMMGIAIQPGVGAVGARLWYPNDTLQHGGVITGIGGVAGHAHKHLNKTAFGYFSRAQLIQTFSVVTAACLIVKKSIFLEVGELDETNLKVGFNDVDFCLRVREAGYRNVWTPYAELYHHESATRGYEDTPEKQARFKDEVLYMKKRWGNSLMNDPAYSPNLTLDHEDFSYAWPPRVSSI